jgi:hypothetical protein
LAGADEMNWVSGNGQLSEEFDKALIIIAIYNFSERRFVEAIDFGMILDMMLMGAEIHDEQ